VLFRSSLEYRTVLKAIDCDVITQIFGISGKRLKGVNVPGGPYAVARKQRVKTHVGANVVNDVTSFEA
jgi:hypothetical protein